MRGADHGVRGIARIDLARAPGVPLDARALGRQVDGLELDLGRDPTGQRVAGHGPAGGRIEGGGVTRDEGRRREAGGAIGPSSGTTGRTILDRASRRAVDLERGR